MQKTVLERFVGKYNLGGAAESVLWNADKKKLSTRFITDDKSCLGIVETTELTLKEGDYGIYDTAQLRSMLSVLDEDIQIRINEVNNKAVSIGLRDAATKITFILSDPSVIIQAPGLKQMPSFDLEFELDSKFMNRFVKGKNALPEVETFHVICDGKKPEVIIGWSETHNTNRVAIDVEWNDDSTLLDRAIGFSARYLKEILLANKEASRGKIKISKQGFAHVSFDIEGFSVDYYLVEVKLA
jgi:hypothetical protein